MCAAEDSIVARDFIDDAIARNGTAPHTVHADRGTSMTSKPVSALLADLGITRSHSRPHVSNDNPYSEAQFKTLKYVHDFPHHFDSLAEAKEFCEGFFGSSRLSGEQEFRSWDGASTREPAPSAKERLDLPPIHRVNDEVRPFRSERWEQQTAPRCGVCPGHSPTGFPADDHARSVAIPRTPLREQTNSTTENSVFRLIGAVDLEL